MDIAFYTALSGLQAAQRQIDTASHNIANANTPGYSRQRVDQTASDPLGFTGSMDQLAIPGHVGTGVTVQQIIRIRDQFIDTQLHTESSKLGEANVQSDALNQIQSIFGEPSDNGLQATMQKFFSDWQELSGDPANDAVRTSLRQDAVDLTQQFNDLSTKLNAMRDDFNNRVAGEVNDINSSTKQIAQLNSQISAALAAKQNPNDLYDKQDQLINDLSTKVKIQVETATDGSRSVYVGGQPLVNLDKSYDLKAVPGAINGYYSVQYATTGLAAPIQGGELKALMDTRDLTLSDTAAGGMLTQLNTLATGLMTAVNAVHSIGFGPTGVTGQTFFDGTSAADMTVNANILNDTALAKGLDVIAAAANDPGSLTGGVGDSQIAVQIAQLQNGFTMAGGSETFQTYYKNVITQLATQGQSAQRTQDTQETLVNSIKDRKDQVSGVSTDEEMANVVRFQNAYAASARVMSTLQSMLDILVNLGK